MTQSPDERLLSLGIKLGDPPVPAANYIPYVAVNDIIYISGQLPLVNGKLEITGRVGENISTEQAANQAKICAINLISQLRVACNGNLNKVEKVIKLGGFVCCTNQFTDQPEVINGASNFMVDIFGQDIGKHARFAIGTSSLPRGTCVEIEGTFKIKE